MNTNTNLRILSSLVVLAAQATPAQDSVPAGAESPNRFGLSYRMGFNLKATINNLGGFTMPTKLTPDGVPYNYSDGYVYEDINHGLADQTWNWGYDAAPAPYKQYTLGDPNVIYHQFSSPANTSSSADVDSPQSNFELTYNRELLRGKGWRAGFEAAVGYGQASVNDSRPLAGDVNVASAAYAVPIDAATGYGVTSFPGYPGSYHDGSFQGPGALLGDAATPLPGQVVRGGASIIGSRKFDADLFGFRVGPYFEVPLGRRVSLNFSGGFALAYVNSTFKYNQTVAISDVGRQSQSGSGSHSDWLPGAYVAGNISVGLSDSWSLVVGAQFEDVGQYTQSVNGKQAKLDLSNSIFVTVGVSYSF
jgi:hypothetical protein